MISLLGNPSRSRPVDDNFIFIKLQVNFSLASDSDSSSFSLFLQEYCARIESLPPK